jgi:hypothetical protein
MSLANVVYHAAASDFMSRKKRLLREKNFLKGKMVKAEKMGENAVAGILVRDIRVMGNELRSNITSGA